MPEGSFGDETQILGASGSPSLAGGAGGGGVFRESSVTASTERLGDQVGPYTLISLIGDGGSARCGWPSGANQIPIRERLELFTQVCEAVQHAHTMGIIHRDLKPSNVLVTRGEDKKPHAKVIDFGVAKALSKRLVEHTVFTETGQMIGTPEYMSPEQADPDATDIDTRSDIYSLGVLLYQLLTGVLPFDPKELRAKAQREIQRIIREVNPPTPSARADQGHGKALEARSLSRVAASPRTRWAFMTCTEMSPSGSQTFWSLPRAGGDGGIFGDHRTTAH